jgi:hypothetical protein
MVQGADSTCAHCGEEEDLEHVLRACPELKSPQEKELCAAPPAALGYVDRSGGGGAVLPGDLRVGAPVTVCRQQTNKQTQFAAQPCVVFGLATEDKLAF